MKALSLSQPWASLVIDGRKYIETRSWCAPKEIIGRTFAIHAAKSIDRTACIDFGYDPKSIVRGAVVGTVFFQRCVRFTPKLVALISAEELRYGNFEIGRFGFVLSYPEKFKLPISAKGSLGFWSWNEF